MNTEILQAIFFDFDGVIVDSTQTKTEGFRALFHEYGDEIVQKVVGYHQQHGGISRVDKIEYAHREIITLPLSDNELCRWAEKYSESVVDKVIGAAWIPGASAFLDFIKGKVSIFVISGTPEKELQYIIESRKISHYFQEILGSPVKKPTHIRKLLNKYHLSADQCIFIGDALTDYNAAMETGMHFIGIQSEVEFPPGTVVLEDCRGLRPAVESLFPVF